MSAVGDEIKAAITLANECQMAGYREGFRAGVQAGLGALQRIIAGESIEDIRADLERKIGAEG